MKKTTYPFRPLSLCDGVSMFLESFVLTVNYPVQTFSIE
jgi:hypothetical protein